MQILLTFYSTAVKCEICFPFLTAVITGTVDADIFDIKKDKFYSKGTDNKGKGLSYWIRKINKTHSFQARCDTVKCLICFPFSTAVITIDANIFDIKKDNFYSRGIENKGKRMSYWIHKINKTRSSQARCDSVTQMFLIIAAWFFHHIDIYLASFAVFEKALCLQCILRQMFQWLTTDVLHNFWT